MPPLCFVPKPEATPVPLVFYPTARSPKFDFFAAGPLQVIDARTQEVVLQVQVPSSLKKALLIFLPAEAGWAGPARYRVQVVDDGEASHAAGTLRILNLSGVELSGTVNRTPVRLQAGLNEPLRVGGTARIVLRTPCNGRNYQSYADDLPIGPDTRGLLLLLPPYRRGSVEVQSRALFDFGVPPSKADRR